MSSEIIAVKYGKRRLTSPTTHTIRCTLSEHNVVPVFFKYLLVNTVIALVAFSNAISFSSGDIILDLSRKRTEDVDDGDVSRGFIRMVGGAVNG
jgi:hypothetical protein